MLIHMFYWHWDEIVSMRGPGGRCAPGKGHIPATFAVTTHWSHLSVLKSNLQESWFNKQADVSAPPDHSSITLVSTWLPHSLPYKYRADSIFLPAPLAQLSKSNARNCRQMSEELLWVQAAKCYSVPQKQQGGFQPSVACMRHVLHQDV